MPTTQAREALIRALAAQDALSRRELPLAYDLEYVDRPPIRVNVGPGYAEVCTGTYSCECRKCQDWEPQPGDLYAEGFAMGFKCAGDRNFVFGMLVCALMAGVAWALKG